MLENVFNFFIKKVVEEGEVSYLPTAAGNVALVLLAIILFIVMAAFSGSKKVKVKQLAFSAMAVTLATVMSLFAVFKLPYGGSITLFSMFFICMIGYLYGLKAGVLAGLAYGFINLILDPAIYYPVQTLLDYPIAYGCLGLAGAFANSKYGLLKGYALGVFGRYICHVLSGYIFFASYAPENMNAMVYSLSYNATYIVPEALVTILLLLLPPVQNALKQVKKMALQD